MKLKQMFGFVLPTVMVIGASSIASADDDCKQADKAYIKAAATTLVTGGACGASLSTGNIPVAAVTCTAAAASIPKLNQAAVNKVECENRGAESAK